MLERIKNDELVKGSLVLFVMIGVFNLLNYIFQISMAKLLGPEGFSVLAVLMAFIYIFSIPSEAIQTVVSRYTSRYNVNKDFGKMKNLLSKSMKKGLLFACILFVVFSPLAKLFSVLLKIDLFLMIITGLFLFYVFSIPIVRGILQGRKKFNLLGLSFIVEGFFKVVISLALVFAGFHIYGAIGGLLIAVVLSMIAGFFMMKEVIRAKKIGENFQGIYLTNLPTLIAVTAIVLMYSLDIIFARMFFSPQVSGVYSFVSLIGKVILFASLAIGKAMFPLSSEGFDSGKSTEHLLKKSLLIVGLISAIACFAFLIMPEFIIKIISLDSAQYTSASNILFILGLSFSFISLANIVITYHIAINKMKSSAFMLFVFAALQTVLFIFLHSTIMEFSLALLCSSIIMFLYSLFLLKK